MPVYQYRYMNNMIYRCLLMLWDGLMYELLLEDQQWFLDVLCEGWPFQGSGGAGGEGGEVKNCEEMPRMLQLLQP